MRKIVLILLCLLVLPLPVAAGDTPDLNTLAGEWTYARKAGNTVLVDTVALAPGEKGLGGTAGQEVFSHFAIDGAGRLSFITKHADGTVARHRGKFSNNNGTVRGNYDLGMGVSGMFVLDRVKKGAPPSMSGRWEYALANPSGGKELADALLYGDSSGWFEGYLHYRHRDTSPKEIKGTVAPDGTVHFKVYEKKTYVHDGALDAAGTGVAGTWTDGTPGSNRFTMKRITK